ncbi:hypothetical protein PPL_03951 [Heterostelium album PN500]|uniref:EGF-like domain-containing protein n=1 Tax=Heterostelium pallidum (strain ATCC 26659 / Pp 5 / PN500) TaxID=670386 RepID=D3B5L3_HETP5|nr:hypothetical protein PPL_03951 [Heterostelium album PN500]EFA83161.1 hypothetical protein PPL_03951 [Heterostelium album PN500]|eukprot:XP_020435278.1 hypothetical protein PPL_03951 [Heterostelium album PN500]
MKLLYSILLIAISIATINCMSITSVEQEIKEKFTTGSVATCVVNNKVSSCSSTPNAYVCPSIISCIRLFNQSQQTQNYQVLISAGSYGPNDCPGYLGVLQFPGSISFIGYNGLVDIQCGSSQFLTLNVGSNPIDIMFDNLSIKGKAEYNGGAIAIGGNSRSALASTLLFSNVISNGSYAGGYGGFAYCSFGKVYVLNSTFAGNTAQSGGGVISAPYGQVVSIQSNYYQNTIYDEEGGAIYSSSANLINSTFIGNNAYMAGAVATIYLMDVVNSTFIENHCSFTGGAIYSLNGINVYGSTFQYNSAGNGGAIFGINITIGLSSFQGNQAQFSGAGGAVYADAENPIQMVVVNSTFDQNSADGIGGAIYTIQTSIFLTGCVFTYNNANNSGGALYIGYRSDIAQVDIINSLLTDNYAALDGGAIYLYQLNSLEGPFMVNLYGTILDRNTAGNYAGGLYFLGYPKQLIGGQFVNSISNEPGSYTFYSLSVQGVNKANITLPYAHEPYFVTIYDEQSFSYYKAIGVIGSCFNGVAQINDDGYILSCSCFAGATGPSCDN